MERSAPVISPVDAREYCVDELLRDGGSIRIRSVRPDDKERLLEHFHTLSPHSVYTRFFTPKRELSAAELAYFTEMDGEHKVGLLATLLTSEGEKILGVGRYFRRDDIGDPRAAEVAFAVSDHEQGRGIATVLLEHLAAIARSHGVTEFVADVLGDNNQMMHVFAHSGFRMRRTIGQGVFHVAFPTAETPAHEEHSAARTHEAEAESLRPLLAPTSVAVVLPSGAVSDVGASMVHRLLDGGFRGPVHVVKEDGGIVEGLKTSARVSDLAAPVDLAVVCVPAAAVPGVVRDCSAERVHGVVVMSPGFADAGEEGRIRERELLSFVRGSGMRMIGPNSAGLLNTDPVHGLHATTAAVVPPPGNVALFSQGPGLGLLKAAAARGLGISSFVSAGNRADVSSNDLLSYWARDPRTDVVVLDVGSFGNSETFAKLAPAVARSKPIVAMTSARGDAREPASRQDGDEPTADLLLARCGVLRATTTEELLGTALLLSTQPLPAGSRIGVVADLAGGVVQALEGRDLVLPELAEETRVTLATLAGGTNPFEMLASATPPQLEEAIVAVGCDPSVDALLVVLVGRPAAHRNELAEAVCRGASRVPAGKPVVTSFFGEHGKPELLSSGPRGGIPSFARLEDAAFALHAATAYARWRASVEEATPQA